MITEEDKLSDVVSANIDLLPIVNRLGLSTHIGEQTIREICLSRAIDIKFTLDILNTFSFADYFPKPENVDIIPLIDFLTKTHHYHKQVTIPRLTGLIDQLKQLMPDEKLLIVVEKYLKKYLKNLIHHIDFEEQEIFPLVKENSFADKKTHVSNLKKLFKQHTNVENEISDLKTIFIRHIPEDVDMDLIFDLLHTLSHFEKEQLDHARFEDKILIPKLFNI